MHLPRTPGRSVRDVAEGADGHRAGGIETALGAGRSRASSQPGRSRSALIVAGLALLLAIPLLVALGVMRQPRWYPIGDLAQTELRVRDVGSSHPPLIGLGGRIGTAHQGSHPGPLSFWAMSPFYRVLGATPWALQAAAVSLHLAAMGATLWIAHRRGGIRLVLGVTALLAVLIRGYEATMLTEAWNPYLPVLWWIVFLLAVWSVVCDDLPLLPVAVFAGLFCTQTHISYALLVAGLGGFAVTVAFLSAYARRQSSGELRHVARWTLLAAAFGALMWLPPVIDQLTNSPGNLTKLWDHFSNPPETPIGLRRGMELLLVHLNPWRLVAKQLGANKWIATGSLVPGSVLLVTWAGTVVAAWRFRHRALLRLHLVLGAALVLAAVSMSRIFGGVFYYLVLWAWGIAALMLFAVAWTVGLLVGSRLGGATRKRAASTAGPLALGGVAVLSTMLFTFDAAYVDIPAPHLSAILGELVPPVVEALDDGSAPGGGRDGHYLVTWGDQVHLGSQVWGLINELDRRGFDVGADKAYRSLVAPHRVIVPARATAVVHLAVGADVETWRARPGVRQVAYVDPRDRKERAEFDRLRSQVIDELKTAGLPDLVPNVDENLAAVLFDRRVPEQTRDRITRMVEDLGVPTAVFVGPPGANG